MKKKKSIKKVSYLDYACEKGETVCWKTISGEKFEGIIKEWQEDNVAIILLKNGTEMSVKC